MSPAATRPPRARNQERTPSVLLVDDHPLWRETLRKVIESTNAARVLAEASDGDEAVAIATAREPDLVIMDIALPGIDGIEATSRIKEALPGTRVLVLSSFEAKRSVLDAVRAGASGYLLKTAGAKEVADAVRRVSDGELVFPPKLAKFVLDELRRISDGPPTYRVALAGDSSVLREGLAHVLDQAGVDVVVQADDVDALLSITERVDVAIIDFHETPDKGVRAASHLRAKRPDLKVLVLAQKVDSLPAVELASGFENGGGYLLRDRVTEVGQLTDAIGRVAEGESVIDPMVVDRLVTPAASSDRLAGLTEREREVLGLMAEGHSNQAICRRLFLSAKTLEKHVRSIFAKLGLDEATDGHRRVLAVLTYLRSLT